MVAELADRESLVKGDVPLRIAQPLRDGRVLGSYRGSCKVHREIRGKGLLIGMKLKKDVLPVRKNALAKGLLAGSAGGNVLRMAPPLIIDESHIREAVGILEQCFEAAQSEPDISA